MISNLTSRIRSLRRTLARCLSVMAVTSAALLPSAAQATLSQTLQSPTADGFGGLISGIYESVAPGTFDVEFYNYQNSNWAFKRDFCGGAANTYATAAIGSMPNTLNASTSAFGLTVTLIYSWGTLRTYRFSGMAIGGGNNFCFVSGDGYRSVTLTATNPVTPVPVISNLRVVSDGAIPGGRNLCVDYSPNPTPAGVNTFDWIENGLARQNGPASSLWTNYVCWNRTTALVDGQNYSVQLRFNGSTSQTSNTLSITVPTTLGTVSAVTATTNDASIPGQIRTAWTATPGATYYQTWFNNGWGPVVNAPATSYTYSPPTNHPNVHTSWVQACSSAAGCTGWVSANGSAASPPPPTCSSVTAASTLIASSANSIRLDVNGLNGTSSMITVTSGANSQSYTATAGAAGNWFVNLPLTAAPFASAYGAFTATANITGLGGTTSCAANANFTRQAPQNASFVSQVVAGVTNPSALTLIASRSYLGTFLFSNTGQSTWGTATHRAGTQQPESNNTFGLNHIVVASNVAPGQSASFGSNLVMPAAPGTYTLSLRPLETNLEWFGAASTPITITVVAAPTPATSVAASDGAFGDRVRVTWTLGQNHSNQRVVRAAVGSTWPSTLPPSSWVTVCDSLAATITSCDDTSAVPGTTYSYRVFGYQSSGSTNGGWDQGAVSGADTGFVPAALTTAPTSFTASTTRATDIRLQWGAFADASRFELQKMLDDASRTVDGALINVAAPASLFDDTQVPRGQRRCYRIRAVNLVGAGPWSSEVCGERLGLTPATLTSSQGTVTSRTRLSWVTPADVSPVSQEVWRLISQNNLANWEQLATLNSSATSYDDQSTRGADVTVDWYLLLQRDATGGVSSWMMSSTSNKSANVASGYANLAPTAIQASPVVANARLAGSTALSVTDPNVTAAGQTEAFSFAVVAQPPSGQGACSVQQQPAQVTWTPPASFNFQGTTSCQVQATDRGGATVTQAITINVSPFVPVAPAGVVATDGSLTNSVRVSWGSVDGATTYRVLRNGAQVGADVSALSYIDTSPVGATVYNYSVRAISADGAASPASATDAGYANVAPTALVVPVVSANAMVAGTSNISVVDANAAAGQPDTFTFAVTGQPPAGQGTCSVQQQPARVTWSPPSSFSFQGNTACTLQVTDAVGATHSQAITINVAAFVPAAPTNVLATDGTLAGAVRVTWNAVTGAVSYRVLRNSVAIASNVSALEFTDTAPDGATIYSYTVIAVSADGAQSPASTADAGFANVAPSANALTATVALLDPSGAAATTILTPTASDPNGVMGLVFSLPTPASALGASLSITNNRIQYVAPTIQLVPGTTSTDSFNFTVTDPGGLSAQGTATLTICAPPGVASVASNAAGSAADTIVVRHTCNGELSMRAEVRRADNSILTSAGTPNTRLSTGTTASVPVNLSLAAPNRAGAYSGTLLLRDALGQMVSFAYTHRVPCPTMELDIAATSLVGSKSPEIPAQTTVTATDNCHLGAPVQAALGANAPRTLGTLAGSAQATVAALGANVHTWRFPATAGGPSSVELNAGTTGETRYTTRIFPVTVLCPEPSIISATLMPSSAQRTLVVQMSVAPCANATIQSLSLNGSWLNAPVSFDLLSTEPGLQRFSASVPMPQVDGTVNGTVSLRFSGGTARDVPIALKYDAREAVQLFGVTVNGRPVTSGTPTVTPSIGAIGLEPVSSSPVSRIQ